MRALVLHWGRTGGGPRFAVDAVDALRSVGIWTAYSSSQQSERAESDRQVGDERLALPTFSSTVGFALGAPRAFWDGRALRGFVEKERIDCVFAAMEQLWQPAAARALRTTGVPYLLGIHDGTFHLGEESRVRAAARRLELRGADGVLTFSRSVTRSFLDAEDFPASRVWTSFLPARPGRPTSRPDDRDGFRFGFFGRLLPYKGLSLLVEAVRAVRRVTEQPFEVEIWGSGDDDALTSADLPSEIRVIRRWVPEQEVETVLERFDAVVAPYIDASQSGVIPLAAAMGIPALITPVGGLVEQVSHERTGIVAESIDPDAFARTMLQAMGDVDHLRALGEAAATRTVSEKSLPAFGQELASTMEQLMLLGKRGR